MNHIVNVGLRLSVTAARDPDGIAVAEPAGRDAQGKRRYRQVTFRQLEDDSNLLADGLRSLGVSDQTRMVLMVRPSIDFISLVFALFKAGAVTVLIDPGMGRKNLVRCLAESEPEGFVAIPLVHAVRSLLRGRFPKSRYHVTVGRRWFWGGTTLAHLRARTLRPGFQPAATAGGRPGADHLYHRQHRSAQGNAVFARQLRSPGGRTPRLLRHPARRIGSARFSAVRPVQLRHGRHHGDSGHGPDAAGPGRSGVDHRGDPRLEHHPGVRLAGPLERRRPLLRRSPDRRCPRCAACCRPARRCRRTSCSG